MFSFITDSVSLASCVTAGNHPKAGVSNLAEHVYAKVHIGIAQFCDVTMLVTGLENS